MKDMFSLRMSKDAQILHFDVQNEYPRIWCLVNPDNENESRYFRFAGTGHPINCVIKNYIGTIKMMNDRLLYHLFEISEDEYKRIGGKQS